jgi:polyhydroxybutyrate depolymerase
MSYFDIVLQNISSTYCVDTNRIYVTGHSNGAAISYRLACERANIIAGTGYYRS